MTNLIAPISVVAAFLGGLQLGYLWGYWAGGEATVKIVRKVVREMIKEEEAKDGG
jgi:hypothetical protein